MARISKRVVDASQPGPKPVFTWDSALPGFGLLVLPSGVKSYIFQYRNTEGRSRRATIAKVGALTPDQARTTAEDMAAQVKAGGDPLDAKRAARDALTVGQLLDAYLESQAFKGKAESTKRTDKGRIIRHLRPLLGHRHADKLQPEDVRKAFASIRDGKTALTEKTRHRGLARVRGGEGAARKCILLLAAIYNWGQGERLVTISPTAGVEIGADGERDVVLDREGYARLFQALSRMEDEKRIRSSVAAVIRVIAMTGARLSEIAALRWRHVDFQAVRIVLPPAAHKTGRKIGKPRVIYLPVAAQEIITDQGPGDPDAFVFKPSKGEGPLSLKKPWSLLHAEAKLPAGLGIHGLRHSLATLFAMTGAQASQVMAALGHRNLSTSQKYIHFAESARASVAERAAAPALEGMASVDDKESA
jgi:integrase